MSRAECPTGDVAASASRSAAPLPEAGGGRRVLASRPLLALATVCGIAGLLAWALWGWVFASEPAQDWMVFYTAARAYFDGNLTLLTDGEALTRTLNQRFAGWLAAPLNLHPWVYPPSFLLLLLPFGLAPPAASFALFIASGFVAALVAGVRFVGRGQASAIVAFSLLLCPAVPFNVMTGQNAFFTAALLVGGFGLIGRFPIAAGILLGVLSCKPQLWLMVPIALLAARQWRALASTGASAALLALLSLGLFGAEIWRAWIALMSGIDPAYQDWVENGRRNGLSVFACVLALGAPAKIASLAQGLAIVIATAAVYAAFRRPAATALRLAALLAATILAAPHASTSDAVLLGLAASLFVVAPRPEPLHRGRLALAAAVWISPLFNPPSVFKAGCLTPLLLLMLLAAVLAEIRGRGAARHVPATG